MKNLKFALVAAFITFAMLSYGAGIPDRPGHVQTLSLEQARTNPDMVQAMYQQIDPDFLSLEQAVYYAIVEFADKVYVIYGSLRDWKFFFMNQMKAKPIPISSNL